MASAPLPLWAEEPPGTASLEQFLAYDEALRIHREEGRSAEALDMLDAFVRMHPDNPYADNALLEMALIRSSLEQHREAEETLSRLLHSYPDSPLRPEAFLRLGTAQLRQGRYRDAARSADNLVSGTPGSSLVPSALLLRGEALLGLGKPRQAVEAALQAAEASEELPATEALRLVNRAARALKEKELDRLLSASDGSAPYAWMALAQVERDLEEERYPQAFDALTDLLLHYPGLVEQERIDEAYALIKQRLLVRGRTVGAVLPLSGRYALFGEKALQGIQTALGLLSPTPAAEGETPFTLVVADSGADPMKAAQAVRDLAEKDRVVAVIGPLFSRTTAAAAEAAGQARVPMISLSPDPRVPEMGEMVFRRSLTDHQQVSRLVQLTHDRLLMTRYAFLYPDSSYGRKLINLFWDELDARGAEVMAVESFPPGNTDFGPQIRSLVGLDRGLTPEEIKMKESGLKVEVEPVIDFDALFIPADYQTVGMMAPQLAFYEADDTLLLGTDGWNSPWMLELGEHYVEGGVFTAGFDMGRDHPATRAFVERYWLTCGEDPQALAAQAYDAALAVRRGVESGEVTDRLTLRDYLLGLEHFPGAEGDLSATPEGDLLQPVMLMEVVGGKTVPFTYGLD